MEVKAGYKQSEVGVIPEDWETKSLAEIGNFRTGPFGTLLKANEYYADEGVPLVSVRDIKEGKLAFNEHTPLVPLPVVRRLPEYLLNSGDIVFGRKGGVDRSAIVQKSQSGCFLGSDGIRIRLSKSYYSPFITYQLQRKQVQAWLLQNATGTTMPSMNQTILKRISLPIPPTLIEQEAIAEALSDADALIEALEQLLAKKRQVKQGTMHELLTGKRRLPGFSGEWKTKKLGELGKFYKGKGLPKDVLFEDGKFPAIPYTAIYTDFNEVFDITFVRNYTSSSDTFFINDPHILIAGSSNMLENVGKVCAYVDDKHVAIGGDIILFKTIDDVRFISYLLNTPQHRKKIVFLSQGSTIRHVYMTTFMQHEIEIPELKEQTAIAEILSDMDAEIAALEGKLSKAREVKQGMMSVLLTGRVRLV